MTDPVTHYLASDGQPKPIADMEFNHLRSATNKLAQSVADNAQHPRARELAAMRMEVGRREVIMQAMQEHLIKLGYLVQEGAPGRFVGYTPEGERTLKDFKTAEGAWFALGQHEGEREKARAGQSATTD